MSDVHPAWLKDTSLESIVYNALTAVGILLRNCERHVQYSQTCHNVVCTCVVFGTDQCCRLLQKPGS